MVKKRGIAGFGRGNRVQAIATSYGLTWVGDIDPDTRRLPTLELFDECQDVARTEGGPSVEFGNHGVKIWTQATAHLKPVRRGYIMLHHDFALPQIYVGASGIGAKTPKNVAAVTFSAALSLIDLMPSEAGSVESDWSLRGPIQRFEADGTELDVPRKIGFDVTCQSDRVAQGQALMTPEALEVLSWLTRSFDLEVRPDRIYAYSNFGDITTDDREVWAWVFSVTSRLVELLRLWGANPEWANGCSLLTSEWVERPRKLEGVLSRHRWGKD